MCTPSGRVGEADHTPSSSAEVKNGGDILYSPIRLRSMVFNYMINYRDNLPFY
jgi:hypothetical protein